MLNPIVPEQEERIFRLMLRQVAEEPVGPMTISRTLSVARPVSRSWLGPNFGEKPMWVARELTLEPPIAPTTQLLADRLACGVVLGATIDRSLRERSNSLLVRGLQLEQLKLLKRFMLLVDMQMMTLRSEDAAFRRMFSEIAAEEATEPYQFATRTLRQFFRRSLVLSRGVIALFDLLRKGSLWDAAVGVYVEQLILALQMERELAKLFVSEAVSRHLGKERFVPGHPHAERAREVLLQRLERGIDQGLLSNPYQGDGSERLMTSLVGEPARFSIRNHRRQSFRRAARDTLGLVKEALSLPEA